MVFSEIVNKRVDQPHYPLWKLKVTDDEYNQLKDELKEVFARTNSFNTIEDDALLYMAEWYRREYRCGQPSKEVIIRSIVPDIEDAETGGRLLVSAARQSARKINNLARQQIIEILEGEENNNTYEHRSFLYQGGLPLKNIFENQNKWSRAIRSMIKKNLDFSETDLPDTASRSTSIKEFCNRIVLAALSHQYDSMPFYCEDENDFIYQFLTTEIERQKNFRIPFDIQWRIIIDEPAKKIFVKYVLDAPQHLTEDFKKKYELQGTVSFRIKVGDRIFAGPEYKNSRSFRPFHCEYSYDGESEISVVVADEERIIRSDALDLSEPHVIHKEGDLFYLGCGYCNDEIRLMFDKDWECTTEQELTEYEYNALSNKILSTTPLNTELIVQNRITQEKEIFKQDKALLWTEFDNLGRRNQNIRTPLYQIDEMRFYRCLDDERKQWVREKKDISFWNPEDRKWHQQPVVGKIKVRVSDGNDGYTTPIPFINTGTPIEMDIIKSTETECHVRFNWENGRIVCQAGILENDYWRFEKRKLDSGNIKCTCTPNNTQKSFTIQVHIPFKGFYLFDISGHRISSTEGKIYIPFEDFRDYRYSLKDENVTIKIENTSLPDIKIESNTEGYFKDVLERIGNFSFRKLLDKKAHSFNSRVEISIQRQGYRFKQCCCLQEYPYRFKRSSEENDKIIVRRGNQNHLEDYKGSIVIIPFPYPCDGDNTYKTERNIVINKDNHGEYIIPEEVRNWKRKVLFVSPQQRALPLWDNMKYNGMNGETRRNKEYRKSCCIKSELESAKIDSDIWRRCLYWYEKIWYNNDPDHEKYSFPWNSILDYKCIADDSNALMELVFILWLNCNSEEDKNNLTYNLIEHERDLNLQWFWLPNVDRTGFKHFFETDECQQKLIRWACSISPEVLSELLQNGVTDDLLRIVNNDFSAFWHQLRKKSMLKGEWMNTNSIVNEEVVDNMLSNNDVSIGIEIDENIILSEIASEVDAPTLNEEIECNLPSATDYSDNAKKFGRRVQLVIDHWNNNINLFHKDPRMRATIAYYFASYPEAFVYFLYKNCNTNR